MSEPKKRGRPPRVPHRIEAMLAGQVSLSTARAYGMVARQIEASGLPALEWLQWAIQHRDATSSDRQAGQHAMSKQTLGVYRAAVARYLALIENPGTRPEDYAGDLPKARPFQRAEPRKKLTDEQERAFRACAERSPEPYRTILLLLLLTGARIFEVCYLRRANIDLSGARVTLIGKGNRPRTIPLVPGALRLLAAHAVREGKRPTVESPFVFVLRETIKGNVIEDVRACAPRDVWQAIQAWPEYAEGEILATVQLHQTRHTVASRMVAHGTPLNTVQEILGHADLKTLSHYLHTDDTARRDALSVMDDA